MIVFIFILFLGGCNVRSFFIVILGGGMMGFLGSFFSVFIGLFWYILFIFKGKKLGKCFGFLILEFGSKSRSLGFFFVGVLFMFRVIC